MRLAEFWHLTVDVEIFSLIKYRQRRTVLIYFHAFLTLAHATFTIFSLPTYISFLLPSKVMFKFSLWQACAALWFHCPLAIWCVKSPNVSCHSCVFDASRSFASYFCFCNSLHLSALLACCFGWIFCVLQKLSNWLLEGLLNVILVGLRKFRFFATQYKVFKKDTSGSRLGHIFYPSHSALFFGLLFMPFLVVNCS